MNKLGACLLLTYCAVAVLGLLHLDHALFWDDEAHVAILARNRMQIGTWSTWDGRNMLPDQDGGGMDRNLNMTLVQMDAPVAETAFRIFGVSTWAGRLPFVLAGLASLVLFSWVVQETFGQAYITMAATALLGFSVNFLPYIRNCRYYALAVLFSLLAYALYRRFLRVPSVTIGLSLGCACTLFFLTSTLNCGAFLVGLMVAHVVLHRKSLRASDLLRLLPGAVLFGWLAALYVGCTRVLKFYTLAPSEPWPVRHGTLLWWNLRELNMTGCMPWIAALALGLAAWRRRSGGGNADPAHGQIRTAAAEWALIGATYIVVLAALEPTPTTLGPRVAETRYWMPVVPLFCGLLAVWLWQVRAGSRGVAASLLMLLLATNLLSFDPFNPTLQLFAPEMVREVAMPYPTAYSEVVDYLRAHAAQDSTVRAIPYFANKPLLFYLGDRMKIACEYSHSSRLTPTAWQLAAPLALETNFPDWFVAFGAQPDLDAKLQYFSRPHLERGCKVAYTYPKVATLDVYWDQTQRPEAAWHSFGPVRHFDLATHGVYIYRRRAAPAGTR